MYYSGSSDGGTGDSREVRIFGSTGDADNIRNEGGFDLCGMRTAISEKSRFAQNHT